MMAGRPSGAERVLHPAAGHGVHGPEGTRDDQLGYGARHVDATDRLYMFGSVMASDVRHRVTEERQRDHLLVEPSLCEDLHHADQAKGAFRMWHAPPLGENVVQVAGVVNQAGAGRGLQSQSLDRSETLDRTNPQEPPRGAGDEFPSRRQE